MRATILSTILLTTLVGCATASDMSEDDADAVDGKGDNGGQVSCTARASSTDEMKDALKRLGRAGGVATLCVSGKFLLPDGGFPGSGTELRIVGEGRNATALWGEIDAETGWKKLRIQRLTFNALSMTNATAQVEVLDSLIFTDVYVQTNPNLPMSLTIERSVIGASGSDGPNGVIATGDGQILNFRLVNNVIRLGVRVGSYTAAPTAHFQIMNNTFIGEHHLTVDNATGIVANNIFTGAGDFSTRIPNSPDVLQTNNAYWGNVFDYASDTQVGVDDVHADCLLDYTGDPDRPKLSAGSPCRGAADYTLAPAKDFVGTTRDAQPDIGAVEGQ